MLIPFANWMFRRVRDCMDFTTDGSSFFLVFRAIPALPAAFLLLGLGVVLYGLSVPGMLTGMVVTMFTGCHSRFVEGGFFMKLLLIVPYLVLLVLTIPCFILAVISGASDVGLNRD